jgi:hypothetical protein
VPEPSDGIFERREHVPVRNPRGDHVLSSEHLWYFSRHDPSAPAADHIRGLTHKGIGGKSGETVASPAFDPYSYFRKGKRGPFFRGIFSQLIQVRIQLFPVIVNFLQREETGFLKIRQPCFHKNSLEVLTTKPHEDDPGGTGISCQSLEHRRSAVKIFAELGTPVRVGKDTDPLDPRGKSTPPLEISRNH